MIAAWMVYAVVVSIPIGLGATVVAALLRRYGAAERWVWVGGLVLVCGLPAWAPVARPAGGDATVAPPASASFAALSLPEVVRVPEAGSLSGLGPLVISLWLALSLVLAARIGYAVLGLTTQRRRWTAGNISGEAVLFSEDVGPAVLGIMRPRIVLPHWVRGLPENQLDFVVRHERQHIRAGDPWLAAAGLLLRVSLPWHPGIWYLTLKLRQALELDCDRRVTRSHTEVASYGETVLAVASRLRTDRTHPLPAFTESASFIRRRLIAMTQPKRSLGAITIALATGLGVLAFAGACETPRPTGIQVEATAVEDPQGERGDVAAAVQAEATPEEVGGPPSTLDVVPESPNFTPFTVAPALVNRAEVVRAMDDFYPSDLRAAGVGGTTRVYVYVTEEGVVSDVRVHESSGNNSLDEAALQVAQRFRMTPATNEDEAVAVWVSFPITFQVR